ncbi:hypothetical protein [Arsukibacterium sp.]|uniref:hypothetical protein n=1 Tax=Arsukibacterium sp. TaxID=1977258 RepID=UPI002FD97DAE
MNKVIVVAAVVAVAAVGGVIYANKHAEGVIIEQIELANKSYAEMAGNGLMPAINLGYQSVSANVLRSTYTISGMDVSVDGLGQVATIESVVAKGIPLNGGLADKASAQIQGVKLAGPVLQLLPPDISVFVQGLALHADYQYRYTPASGELLFEQDTRINDELSLSYRFTLSQMQQLWAYAKELSELSPAEQQELSMQDSYIADVTAKLMTAAINDGQLVINNNGFIERMVDMGSQAGMMPPLDALRGMALMGLAADETLPLSFKESLVNFVNQPNKLTLSFGFTEPLALTAIESGELLPVMQTPEQMIEFANVKLLAE